VKRSVKLDIFEQHDHVTYYSFTYSDEESCAFDLFLDAWDDDDHKEDIDIILSWIDKMGLKGADDGMFRPEIGDLKALPIDTSILRLYCFKVTEGIVILGNGAEKTTRTFNEDPTLNAHAMNILSIGRILRSLIKNGTVSANNNELFGLKKITFEAI